MRLVACFLQIRKLDKITAAEQRTVVARVLTRLNFIVNKKQMQFSFMKITSFIFLLLLLVLPGYSTTPQGNFNDENILLNVPIPESGWTFRSGKKDGDDVMLWTKKQEWLRVNILHGRGRRTPQTFRLGIDDAARNGLTSNLESTVLKEGFINNYPMVLWETDATLKDGAKAVNLFLYIEGNDAGYWVNRRWLNPDVSQTEKESWVKYLSSISVCDSRSVEHPCPIKEGTRAANYSDMTNAVPK